MVDTPGLLDRPTSERNKIELQAIAALEHLGDALVFLLDRTSDSTTHISEQESLLQEVRGMILERPIILVSSKSDLLDSAKNDGEHRLSSETGEGLEDLRNLLIDVIAADEVSDPLSLPEHWHRDDSK